MKQVYLLRQDRRNCRDFPDNRGVVIIYCIAGISDPVTISIDLLCVGYYRTVIRSIQDSVVVVIRIRYIPDIISIGIS